MMPALKLITRPTSPFAARIMIQAHAKGLDLATMPPPMGMGSESLYAISPFGKIPVLMSDDRPIIESAAIQEYLEDLYPEPSLRGDGIMITAQVRAYVRAIDLYLFPKLFELRAAAAGNQQADNEPCTDAKNTVDDFAALLEKLSHLHGAQTYCCGNGLTLADCALIPVKFYADRFLAGQAMIAPFSRFPVYANWWQTVSRHPAVERVIAELSAALDNKG